MNDKQSKTMQIVRDSLVKSSLPFNRVFNSPDGKEVLAKLKQEFDPVTICKSDPHLTVVMSAQRDVIRYIEEMIKLREENHELER